MNGRVVRFLGAVVAISFVLACSRPMPTGYLDQQASLQPARYMDNVWCSDRVAQTPSYANVRVASVEGRGIVDGEGVSVDEAVAWLRSELNPPSDPEATWMRLTGEGPNVDLEAAITEMTPGSVMKRFWAAEFGAGHAYVQVEARLKDATDGELLCEMVQRTRASGGVGFQDLGGDAGPAMVRRMLGMVARAMRSEIRAQLGVTTER